MFVKETGLYLVPLPHKPFCVQLKEKKNKLNSHVGGTPLFCRLSCRIAPASAQETARVSGTGRMSSTVRKVPACCRHLPRADISVFSQEPLSQKQIDRIST